MNSKTIELQLLQLEEAFSKSRSNNYSDPKKERHFLELHLLFKAIKDSNYVALDAVDINNHVYILDIIFRGLEYLDNSTLNVIPHEIVSCLEYALNDWISSESFIIVTSLSSKNSRNEFLFESIGRENFNLINSYIQDKYSLTITDRLIQIVLPKILSRDYLCCVVLYHELGHFVDVELNISKKLLLKEYDVDLPTNDEQKKFIHHKMEFFADLFASQYINNASNNYLDHISQNQPESITHPATVDRLKTVNDFITGQTCAAATELNNVLKLSSQPLLKIRHKVIDTEHSDFNELIPQHLDSKEQLHYIFQLGWDLWNDSNKNFLKDFMPRNRYQIINNLIEKSISNFTITEKWNGLVTK